MQTFDHSVNNPVTVSELVEGIIQGIEADILANKVGVHTRQIARWINGTRPQQKHMAKLYEIAKMMKLVPEYENDLVRIFALTGGTQWPPHSTSKAKAETEKMVVKLIEAHNNNQRAAALTLGVTSTTIHNMRAGKTIPHKTTYRALKAWYLSQLMRQK